MKTLLISTTLFLIAASSWGQRYLWVNDTVAIDSKTAISMLDAQERLHPLFDKYGMFHWAGADPIEVKMGMNDTLFVFTMPRKESENIRLAGYYGWLNNYFSQLFTKRTGMESMYGNVHNIKFHAPGEYTINAWNKEYIVYPEDWSIPSGYDQGCNCAFDKTPVIGSSISLSFNGRGVKVVSEKVSTHGIVNVYLDNKLVKENVDLHSETTVKPYTLFEVNNLDSKQHNVDIEVVGKNPASSNYYFVLHRFDVTNKRVEPEAQIVYDTVRIENKITVYDTVQVQDYEQIERTLLSNHNEYHKALESAVKIGLQDNYIYPDADWSAVRTGYYEVYWTPGGILIKQPDIEIE